jgi:dinuclear metal center YbgI/SA1388 family protein
MKLETLVTFLNRELKVKSIRDPWCKNGLQVHASGDIKKIGLATDACMEVFTKAKKLGCDLVITHHGLVPKKGYSRKPASRKAAYLKKNRISLYSCHLPLDKHEKYGNNITLANMIDAKPYERFSGVGYICYMTKLQSVSSICAMFRRKLDANCKAYRFGKSKNIRRVAICSGYGGGETAEEAMAKHVDLFITGEISHGTYVDLRDEGLSVLELGHYTSETIGVRQIGKLLEEKFKLQAVFIDAPTGL